MFWYIICFAFWLHFAWMKWKDFEENCTKSANLIGFWRFNRSAVQSTPWHLLSVHFRCSSVDVDYIVIFDMVDRPAPQQLTKTLQQTIQEDGGLVSDDGTTFDVDQESIVFEGTHHWAETNSTRFKIYYHPQTKFAKVMFLHLSVSHSVHIGISRPTPRGEVRGLARGVSRPTPREGLGGLAGGSLGSHPGGRLGGLARGRGVSGPTPRGEVGGSGWGVSRPTPGGVSQHALRQTPHPPADGYCYGRYTSYWNAFLFINKI